MAQPTPNDVTRLLRGWRDGESDALEDLLPVVYDELRQLAGHYLRRERVGHTLQTNALVHEALIKLTGGQPLDLADRSHFFSVAAQAMRRVLVDHARRHRAGKRFAPQQRVALDVEHGPQVEVDFDVLALHESLEVLTRIHPRQAKIVELRYFGGLNNEEVAAVLDISLATLARDWRVARVWLRHRLSRNDTEANARTPS